MAKVASAGVLDAVLTKIATSTTLTILSAQPTTYADIATYALASSALTAGAGGTSFGAITPSGSNQTMQVNAISGISVTTSGTATYVSVDDGTDYTVTTVTSQALNSGGTTNITAWTITSAQPT